MIDKHQLAAALENSLGGRACIAGRDLELVPKAERVGFAAGLPASPAMLERIELAYNAAAPSVREELPLAAFVTEVRREARFRSLTASARDPARLLVPGGTVAAYDERIAEARRVVDQRERDLAPIRADLAAMVRERDLLRASDGGAR